MRPVKRGFVNKKSSAKTFRNNTKKTKLQNIKTGPMRGGIRL